MSNEPKIVIPFKDIYDSFRSHPEIGPVMTHHAICEITRQIIQLMENDFVNFAANLKKFLNYDLIFQPKLNFELLGIIDYFCAEAGVAIYFRLHQYGLFDQRFRATHDLLEDNNSKCPFTLELVTRDFLLLLSGLEMRINNSVARLPVSNI